MQDKVSLKNRFAGEVLQFLPYRIKHSLMQTDTNILTDLEEIRLRSGKPAMLHYRGTDGFLHENGRVLGRPSNMLVSAEELADTVYKFCENSWYAYQDDISKGFITIRGGHRIGIVGTPVIKDGLVINMRDISSVNIRFAREVIGCGERTVNYLINGSRDIYNTLIISPPGLGKTTLLRDIVRCLSEGFGFFSGVKIGVVDERGEIAACYKGYPQNDLGSRTDVINGIHKKVGMEILLRSMSPCVIALDEMGSPEDVSAVMQVINAGIRIIGTVHGYDIRAVKMRRGFYELFEDKAFERFIIISVDTKLQYCVKVLDGDGNVLDVEYQSGRKHPYNSKFNNGGLCVFPAAYRTGGMHTGNSGISDGT
ncbi:MAG: stage III sporulation protein AA [Clostridiaceae bacterium]|nr:stage III sporulation protein AA [Clostridiaceae bacterium]